MISRMVSTAGGLWRHAGLALACLLLGGGLAHADYCQQLEAQLSALGPGSRTNPQQIGRYDEAIATQQGELQKAREQARQAGCGVRGSAMCASLDATIGRMNANLADLQRTRQRLASSAAIRSERSRLEALLRTSGCRETEQAERRLPPPVDGAVPGVTDGRSGTRIAVSDDGTRYRTLCVRMCDGFYFPISHSTPRTQFESDERLCQARCPGTAVQLHYHRFPGQEADEMISVPTGVAYRDSENAFRYRQASWERPDNCGCGPERGFEVVAGERRSEPPLADADAAAEDEGADSQEEQASLPARSGSFHIQEAPAEVRDDEPPVEDAARAPADADEIDDTTTASQRPLVEDDENRRIRVVGPRFLPDPEEAIDLRAPAPARAR